jgi:hypothetical protein
MTIKDLSRIVLSSQQQQDSNKEIQHRNLEADHFIFGIARNTNLHPIPATLYKDTVALIIS